MSKVRQPMYHILSIFFSYENNLNDYLKYINENKMYIVQCTYFNDPSSKIGYLYFLTPNPLISYPVHPLGKAHILYSKIYLAFEISGENINSYGVNLSKFSRWINWRIYLLLEVSIRNKSIQSDQVSIKMASYIFEVI